MFYEIDEFKEANEAVKLITSCSDTDRLPQTADLSLLMSGHLVMKYLIQNKPELAAGLVVCHYLKDISDSFTLGAADRFGLKLIEDQMHGSYDGCQQLCSTWYQVYYRLKTHELFGAVVDKLDGNKLGRLIDYIYGFRILEGGELFELEAIALEHHTLLLMC